MKCGSKHCGWCWYIVVLFIIKHIAVHYHECMYLNYNSVGKVFHNFYVSSIGSYMLYF